MKGLQGSDGIYIRAIDLQNLLSECAQEARDVKTLAKFINAMKHDLAKFERDWMDKSGR